jgi:hypothetical protein
MTDTAKTAWLTLTALVLSFGLALLGKLTDPWVTVVGYALGIQAGGAAAIGVAKPAGEWLSAKAAAVRSTLKS